MTTNTYFFVTRNLTELYIHKKIVFQVVPISEFQARFRDTGEVKPFCYPTREQAYAVRDRLQEEADAEAKLNETQK